jgi:hypothetical protein
LANPTDGVNVTSTNLSREGQFHLVNPSATLNGLASDPGASKPTANLSALPPCVIGLGVCQVQSRKQVHRRGYREPDGAHLPEAFQQMAGDRKVHGALPTARRDPSSTTWCSIG